MQMSKKTFEIRNFFFMASLYQADKFVTTKKYSSFFCEWCNCECIAENESLEEEYAAEYEFYCGGFCLKMMSQYRKKLKNLKKRYHKR